MAKNIGTKLTVDVEGVEQKIERVISKVSNLKETLKKLDSAFTDNKTNVEKESLQQLVGVLDNVDKEINDINKSASVGAVKKFTQDLKETSKEAENASNGFKKVAEQIEDVGDDKAKGFLSTLKDIGKQGTSMASLLKTAFGSTGEIIVGVISIVKNLIGAIKNLISTIGSLINKFMEASKPQMEYLEDLNFLENAYGDANNSGKQLLDTLNQMVGYDQAGLIKQLSIYRQMGNALDLDADVANKLSENLLKLSVDVKSLTGQELQNVASKFQSAMAGNIRAVRAYGVDITQAALQQELYRMGIDRQISSLSRAEKSILTYLVMERQLSTANGDLANTVNSVANQWEIFQNQIAELGRLIGGFFIPILSKILPILNGIIMALNTIIKTIMGFFGINAEALTEQAGSSRREVEGISTAFDDAANSANKANKAAKEMQKTLRGFDKLNNITTPTSSGSSSRGGIASGGVGGIDPGLLNALGEYNLHLDEMANKAVEIRDKILGLVDWEKFSRVISPIIKEIKELYNILVESGFLDFIEEFIVNVAKGGLITFLLEVEKWLILIAIAVETVGTNIKIYKWIWDNAQKVIQKIADALDTVVKVIEFLGYVTMRLYQEYIKPYIVEFFNNHVKPALEEVRKKFNELKETIDEKVRPVIETIKTKFDNFRTSIEEVYNKIKDKLNPKIDDAKDKFDNMKNALKPLKDIVDALKEAFEGLKNALKSIKEGKFGDAFEGIKNTFDRTLGKMSSPVQKLVENLQKLAGSNNGGLVSKAGSALNAIKTLLGKANGGIWNNGIWSPVKAYAGGGFPSRGEIFMARETKGPEMVGRIGSSTAVLNNDQILEQMTIAVARGIAASGGQEKQVNIIAEGDTEGLLQFINFKNASKNRQYGL